MTVTPRPPRSGFDGIAGRLAAAVMARLNRDMEAATVEELDPSPADRVLSVGFGPGVGIERLADLGVVTSATRRFRTGPALILRAT